MVVVDTHCHASPYWFEPIEVLLDEMTRNGVDKAVLIQFRGVFDNSYLIESMRRFPDGAGQIQQRRGQRVGVRPDRRRVMALSLTPWAMRMLPWSG